MVNRIPCRDIRSNLEYAKSSAEMRGNMYNIAIDGPAGAGKSTIARMAAEKLGFIYVDTGAMYRAMALYFIRNGISSSDEEAIEAACKDINISIEYQDGEQVVLLGSENVNAFIRTEEVSMMTSDISKYAAVREKLLDVQRNLARTKDVIMRRYKELEAKGVPCDLEKTKQDIILRDEQDMNREISPLRQAEDAVLLDSSDLSIEEAVSAVIDIYNKKRG